MLRPSIEITSPSAAIVERQAVLSRQATDGLRESASTASSQTGEEERASSVCAAGWAY